MGWTGYYMGCPKGKERMAEVVRLEGLNWENEQIKDEVVASSMYSSTCYFVIRRTDKQNGGVRYYATVCLTQYDKRRGEFLVKTMDETCGPCEAHMPRRMLDMLSPTDSAYALNWRKKCAQNLAGNPSKLSKLPLGTHLRVNHPSKRTFIVSLHRGRRAYIADDYSCRISAATLNRLGYEVIKQSGVTP